MITMQKKIKTDNCLIFRFTTEAERTMFLGEIQTRDADVCYCLNTKPPRDSERVRVLEGFFVAIAQEWMDEHASADYRVDGQRLGGRMYAILAKDEGWNIPTGVSGEWRAADVKWACRQARHTKSKTDSDVLFLADLAAFRKISLQQMARETVLQARSKAWLLQMCEGDGVAVKGVSRVESMRQKIADGLTPTNVKRLRELEETRKRLALEKMQGNPPSTTNESEYAI